MRRALLLLMLVLFPAEGRTQDVGDFSAAKKRFEASFRPNKKFEARLDAAAAVSVFDTGDAAKLLVSGFRRTQLILNPSLERLEKVLKQLEGYRGRTMLDPDWRATPEAHQAMRALRKEAAQLQNKVDGEHQVFGALREGLTSMRSDDAVTYFVKTALRSESFGAARAAVAAALGEIGDPSSIKPLIAALGDKDARVKAAAAVSLGKLKAKDALVKLLRLLKDKGWEVRSAVIQALGEIDQKEAVGPLIEQIEKEEGRLREDCAQALTKLTGMKFGQSVDLWRRWWEEHKHEYGEEGKPLGGHPPDSGGDPGPGYYGIPVVTSKAIFILDISGSMTKSAKDHGRDPEKGELAKIDVAKRELARTLKTFAPKGSFNVIVFNDSVKRWQEKMVTATKGAKEQAIAFIMGLEASSSTNIFDAMHLAFKTAGMGSRDKYYALGADTIFLLSDGSPTKPDGSMDDWMKIIRGVREWNKLKRVKIHAIGVGGHNAQFMSMLASENGGKYVAR